MNGRCTDCGETTDECECATTCYVCGLLWEHCGCSDERNDEYEDYDDEDE